MSFQSRFKYFLNLSGKVFRQQPGRLTKAIQLNGEDCFVKLHFGVGYREIFKNLLQGRLPILGARTEYQALKKLAEIGIPSLEVLEFDVSGKNPAHQRSYLVTKTLKNVVSLEDLCISWQKTLPTLTFKRALIRALAEIAGRMHAHGMNHRDFYLCHFLLDETLYVHEQKIKLYLIDLHRAQMRAKVPWRWRVKDIAGLYFSALHLPLTRRDLFCFMRTYQQYDPTFRCDASFWRPVESRAWALYEKIYFKKMPGVFTSAVMNPHFSEHFLQDFLVQPDDVMTGGKLIKHDATTTVVKIETPPVIIKRYNARDFKKGLKRLFKTSRARRSWLQALRLRHLGVATPKPIAMMERLRFGVLRESYIVTEYLPGQDLLSYVRAHPEKMPEVMREMEVIFSTLKAIRTAHGDFKATNLWWFEDKIYLLDLDGVRQYDHDDKLQKALAKDKCRFLKNWKDLDGFVQ